MSNETFPLEAFATIHVDYILCLVHESLLGKKIWWSVWAFAHQTWHAMFLHSLQQIKWGQNYTTWWWPFFQSTVNSPISAPLIFESKNTVLLDTFGHISARKWSDFHSVKSYFKVKMPSLQWEHPLSLSVPSSMPHWGMYCIRENWYR